MKKRFALTISLFMFVSLLTLTFVSAASTSKTGKNLVDEIALTLNPILKFALGSVQGTNQISAGELLFIKFLFFILLIALIDFGTSKVPGFSSRKPLKWTISIVLSILFVRYLTTPEMVNFLWTPSGVLGMTVVSLLPFIIFFFFIESMDSTVIRKVGWALFVILFIGLAFTRWDTFNPTKTGHAFNLAWIYVATAIISTLMFLFDKDIHTYFIMKAIEEKGKELDNLRITNLQNDLEAQRNVLANPLSSDADREKAKKQIRSIKKQIKEVLRA